MRARMSETEQPTAPSPAAPARGPNRQACKAALDYLSGAMVKLIPVLLVCGMFKTAQTLIGPSMLSLVGETDNLYALLGMVYDAGFYFMPIYLGYSYAEKLGGTPVLGSLLGGIMMVPAFAQLAGDGAAFTVYGIPCTPVDYSRTVIPIVMSAALLAVLEVHLRKVLPKVLAPMFAPLLAMAITLPAALCAQAPWAPGVETHWGRRSSRWATKAGWSRFWAWASSRPAGSFSPLPGCSRSCLRLGLQTCSPWGRTHLCWWGQALLWAGLSAGSGRAQRT